MSDNWDLEAWLSRLEALRTDSLPLEERNCSICRLPYAPTSPLTTEPPTPNTLTVNDKVQDAEEPTAEEPTDEHPVELPCGHIFGNQCTKKWLTPKHQGGGGGRDCPICRDRIIPNKSYSSDEEDEDDNDDDDQGIETEEARILRRGGYGDDEEEEDQYARNNRIGDPDEEMEEGEGDVSESEMVDGVEYEEYDPTETGFYRRFRVRRRVSMDYGTPL